MNHLAFGNAPGKVQGDLFPAGGCGEIAPQFLLDRILLTPNFRFPAAAELGSCCRNSGAEWRQILSREPNRVIHRIRSGRIGPPSVQDIL